MRRRLTVLVVGLVGLLAGWLMLRGGEADEEETGGAPESRPVVEDHAGQDGAGQADAVEPVAARPQPADAEPRAAAPADAAPTEAVPCDPCFDGVPLDWDRSPEQVAAVHAWSPETMAAATAALWEQHEQGKLDFARARRADQSLHIDRVFGTELDPQVRSAVLDRHSQLQEELAAARSGGGGAAAMADAVGSYEAALGDLLTDAQLDRLLNL